jgi:lauroyl/myristoyl acyltransferase
MPLLLAYKCLKFIFRYLIPAPIRYPLARSIARNIIRLNHRRRDVIVRNLTPLVGPPTAEQLAPELLGNFLMTAVDFFCTRPQLSRDVVIEGWSRVEEAYRDRKRVIIVTAHFGNWEIGIPYLIERGYPVASIYAATYSNDATVRWIMSHRNPRAEWIPSLPGAAESCIAAIEAGRILCIAADIPYGENGRRVSIAGHSTHLPMGPWAIALRSEAVVLPAFVLRRAPGRYRAVIHEPIRAEAGSLKQQLRQMQDAYRRHLEYYLKNYPEQWGNLQPFWDPTGN